MREDRLGARMRPSGAWRGGCEGGAARDDSIAPHPPRRRKPGGWRPYADVRRRPGRARGTRKRDQSRGSAAGFRKRRERPTPSRRMLPILPVLPVSMLPIPNWYWIWRLATFSHWQHFCPPRRKAQRAPAQEPRPPETGRACPQHTPTPMHAVPPPLAKKSWGPPIVNRIGRLTKMHGRGYNIVVS